MAMEEQFVEEMLASKEVFRDWGIIQGVQVGYRELFQVDPLAEQRILANTVVGLEKPVHIVLTFQITAQLVIPLQVAITDEMGHEYYRHLHIIISP
jgi:hypothetical protein